MEGARRGCEMTIEVKLAATFQDGSVFLAIVIGGGRARKSTSQQCGTTMEGLDPAFSMTRRWCVVCFGSNFRPTWGRRA